MRSLVSAVVLAFALVACCGTKQPVAVSQDSCPVVDITSKTVGLVRRLEDGKVKPYCTGVWVAPNLILTAAHCVADAEDGDIVAYVTHDDVYGPNGDELERVETHGALVDARDDDRDLALIRTADTSPHQVAILTTEPIEQGQSVEAMGHSIGLWWSYSCGTIGAIRTMDLGRGSPQLTWIQSTVPISPGNSGGGLWDHDGHLIGIASASFVRGQNLNIFIHRKHIVDFLRGRR